MTSAPPLPAVAVFPVDAAANSLGLRLGGFSSHTRAASPPQRSGAAANSSPLPRQQIDWAVIYPPFPLGNPAAFGHGPMARGK